MEQEITFESHPISFIQQLEQEIEDNHPSRLTSEDIEDVSDNYQAHLAKMIANGATVWHF